MTNKNDKPRLVTNSVINYNCPYHNSICESLSRKCPPIELVKNGGFEILGLTSLFEGWEISTNRALVSQHTIPYEGKFNAEIVSEPTEMAQDKLAIIKQNIPVTPGCYLKLSYADNFFSAGTEFFFARVQATVYYASSSGPVELIKIETNYDSTQEGNKYKYHEKTSDIPIPPEVDVVTVQFLFTMNNVNGLPIIFYLDGVSLRYA
jgi:hypothetical protein